MSLSLIRKQTCPICGRPAIEKSRIGFAKSKLISLECGHLLTEEKLTSVNYNELQSSDGKKLLPYQIDGVKFAEESGARCLIADEQGLGKTIQSLAVLQLHLDKLSPAVILTKTTLKLQWALEILRWTGKTAQVIQSSKEIAVPGFDIYVITYDILKSEKVFQFVQIRTIILDECQAIKNHLSGRAKAVQKIVANHKIEHIIGLSGTPIKNNAAEYFTILNLLDARRFGNFDRFVRYYCDSYESMYGYKVGGLSRPDEFRELTKDLIIRRTKAEVLKDLPELTRRFHHVELAANLTNAYNEAGKELEELFYSDNDENTMTSMIAVMTTMRQITGVSKVNECIDFVTDFLLSTDRKLVIFVHHKVVASLLKDGLNKWMQDGNYPEVLNLSSDLDGDARAAVVQRFSEPANRILIASTLASGEGLNLQFCSDAIMLERQWNPANEEQAESRFHRFGQVNPVTVTYMLATETIDEYFTEIVERKRAIVAQTLDGKDVNWEQNNLMRELAQMIVTKGSKKWRL